MTSTIYTDDRAFPECWEDFKVGQREWCWLLNNVKYAPPTVIDTSDQLLVDLLHPDLSETRNAGEYGM